MALPKITFGIIVLNGEPFTRYNLRAVYPFAHQIIVVEGAGPFAKHMATSDGHSIDGTLELLQKFKREEDPEDKVLIVTAENDGHPNGFWPGEKDEQSQAYAKRATGNWLWQVDIDEFYKPQDMRRICEYLADNPDTNCLTFNFFHFWGGFDYIVNGGLFMSQRFGEPWGAARRVFKWGEGFRYGKHRPPTVFDGAGTDITLTNKYNISKLPNFSPVYMYHYSNVFPDQVIAKGRYYASFIPDAQDQQEKFEGFMEPLDETRAIKVFDFFGRYHWITRFGSSHPSAIQELIRDLRNGKFHLSLRQTE